MKLVGVTAYGFNVRNLENRNEELHNICGNGTNFLDNLETVALATVGEYNNDVNAENVFAYDEVERETVRNAANQGIYDVLYLRIKTGEYGEESEIVDRQTGETRYRKNVNEADVIPFGCCAMLPCGEYDEGIILLQSLGRNGITSVIKTKFNEYVRMIDENLRVAFKPIVPRTYMNRLLEEGVLKKIRLISYGMEDDDADRLGIDRGVREIVQERVIKAPTGFIRNKAESILQCVRGEIRYDQIVEVDDNFELDDLKLEFRMGRRDKTISLRGLDQLVINEDITDEVILENGHPTFASLKQVMREIGEGYLRARGFID